MDANDSKTGFNQGRTKDAFLWDSHAAPHVQSFDPTSSPRLRHNSMRTGYGYLAATPDVSVDGWGKRSRPPRDDSPSPKIHSDVHGSVAPTRNSSSLLSRCLSRVNWTSQLPWLGLYFSLNLFLTLSNKSVLTGFPYPYTLTAIHAFCSACGGLILRLRGLYAPKRLSIRQELVLTAFSFLYSINIAVSNVSLHLVTVPVCSFQHVKKRAS